MSASRLEYLFDRYVNNIHSKTEEEELMALLALKENESLARELIDKLIEHTGPEMQMPDQSSAIVLQNILQRNVVPLRAEKNTATAFQIFVRVAAILILLLSGAGYWFFTRQTHSQVETLAEKKSPPRTVHDRALLTMSDGSTIVLDGIQKGTLQHGDIRIHTNNRLLVFDTATVNAHAPVLYSTLSTPPGSQYRVVLPDGTKVWLNAGSSINFPSRFTGAQRQVELTGEAYFEVARNEKKPFLVKTGEMSVQVLGTHFNVNAYGDDGTIQTSLLEGSVKIVKGSVSKVLAPGQKAVLDNRQESIGVTRANMEQVMAWKNGLFQFEGADIIAIMREISRWYGAEVVYAGKVPVRHFEGKISRDASLAEVLKILELSDVQFSVEGKKIIVQ